MLDTIPGKKEMADLVGEPLYDIWNKLCALMRWIACGIKGAKRGHMNINTAGAVKRCVHYMQGKTAWVL